MYHRQKNNNFEIFAVDGITAGEWLWSRVPCPLFRYSLTRTVENQVEHNTDFGTLLVKAVICLTTVISPNILSSMGMMT
ncbi:hypothetical protein MAR_020104 [Mya arenaria]|uniref:Uncharacterized protein n=1 Tax=Mya arenaria TaxID=6604 RepID=A0ABY7E718_MYAAR|nr:hypothetical protein MAR_020104 [Mya arenaria]